MECSPVQALFWIICFILIYKLLDYLVRLPRVRTISDRYIFITGCDTGFGSFLAKRLDNKGCHVIAGCLTEKGETELRKETSCRLKTVQLDVTKHQNVIKAFETVKGILPSGKGLWAVVNNAGIAGKLGPAEWLKTKDYLDIFAVNLFGTIDVSTTFLPLIKLERGRIINTSSMLGRYALPMSYPYALSKFGVEAFSDGFRRQLRETGVTVHILEPGNHATSISSVENLLEVARKTWTEAEIKNKHLYEDQVQKCIDEFTQMLSKAKGGDPENVVDASEHAILALYPKARYLIGKDAKFLAFFQMLPEWISDRLLPTSKNSMNLDIEP